MSIIKARGEGRALWLLGSLFDIKVTGEESGGKCTIVELTVGPKQMGAPPHVHSGEEVAYVVDGTVKYRVGDKTFDAGPGTTIYITPGDWEWFENVTDKPARLLIVYTPGGMDKFFNEVAEPARAREVPPAPSGPPDLDKLVAAATKYGLQIKPPPGR